MIAPAADGCKRLLGRLVLRGEGTHQVIVAFIAEDIASLVLPLGMANFNSEQTALTVLVVPTTWHQLEIAPIKRLAIEFGLKQPVCSLLSRY